MTSGWMQAVIVSAAGFVLGATTIVAARYMRSWSRQPPGERRILPLHVWLVAVSYDLLVIGVMIQALTLIRWWHPWLFLPALTLGLYSMVVLTGRSTKPTQMGGRPYE